MKRKRRSSVPCFHQNKNDLAGEASNLQPEVQSLGPTVTDLPFSVVANILLRLPLRSVLICKCVCKTLRVLISGSKFTELHCEKYPVYLMIRTKNPKRVSRNLHLLEFDPGKFTEGTYCFSRGYVTPDWDKCCGCHDSPMPDCQFHWLADSIYKLPLRDAKMVLDSDIDSARRGKYIASKPKDDKFGVVNSCNGLICLCDPKYRIPIVVCNPVTGEFIRLPEGSKIEKLKDPMSSGLGFYAKSNKYVVVRLYDKYELVRGKVWKYVEKVAEMHTLGTSTWESLGKSPYPEYDGWKCPTYLDGIYWLCFNPEGAIKIVFFDLENRKFNIVPSPPPRRHNALSFLNRDRICMGTLNGLLYICDSVPLRIRLWVKKTNEAGNI